MVSRAACPFVGRDTALAELRTGLEEAVAGRGRLLLIAGEPGIGKSRLDRLAYFGVILQDLSRRLEEPAAYDRTVEPYRPGQGASLLSNSGRMPSSGRR